MAYVTTAKRLSLQSSTLPFGFTLLEGRSFQTCMMPLSKRNKAVGFRNNCVCIVLVCLFLYLFSFLRGHEVTDGASSLQIIVLTMNRAECLGQLLRSLEDAQYGSSVVRLFIRFDHHPEQEEALQVAERFKFSHGRKSIHRANASRGLANAWFDSWQPSSPKEISIILEDDITLSPDWYSWLTGAWARYSGRDDIAGISLQRQVLVPAEPHMQYEIVNDHVPFLYSLVGSIAFSPSAKRWCEFRRWLQVIDWQTFDVSTRGLVTSKWWNELDKRHMWTQHFIYFCLLRDLYTMYINLPNKKTLAAHLRAKGAHYDGNQGADFEIGVVKEYKFPSEVQRYGWDGKLVSSEHNVIPSNGVSIMSNMLQDMSNFKGIHRSPILIVTNYATVSQTMRLIHKVGQKNRLNETLILCTQFKVARMIQEYDPLPIVITQPRLAIPKHINFGHIYVMELKPRHETSLRNQTILHFWERWSPT